MSYSSSRRDYYAPRDHTYSSEEEDGEIEREVRTAKTKRSPDRYYDEYDESERHRDRDSYSSRPDRFDRRHQHRSHHEKREPSDVRRYEHRSSHSRSNEERQRAAKRKDDQPDHRDRHRHRPLREADRDEKGHRLPDDDLRNRIKKRHHEHVHPEREDRDSGKSQPTTPAPDEVKPVFKKAASLIEVEDIDPSDEEVVVVPTESVNNHPIETKAESRNQSPELSSNNTPHVDEVPIDDLNSGLSEPESGDPHQIQTYFPAIQGCRNVEEFHCMNRIEEGTYGIVFRAKCKKTGKIVALKRLKMEKEREGFPITSLREINTLMKSPHENIVRVMEIVVGSNMDKIYIVMEFVEHDLKSLMEQMKKPFLPGEVKTLMIQLLRAIAHLHDNWILHRDLKTSNLLLSHRGVLKVGDFGLAREYGSPLKQYTPVVVTLWYRAPELLLETPKYSTPIDVWSIGCIFGELLAMKPFFPGKSEIDQLNLIFKDLGTPSDNVWPGFSSFPLVKKVSFPVQPYNKLDQRIRGDKLSKEGLDLMMRFLAYCPERRISAAKALGHEYFKESPKPVETWAFPTWPARSEGSARPKQQHSPKAPVGGQFADRVAGVNDDILMGNFRGPGFSLKF